MSWGGKAAVSVSCTARVVAGPLCHDFSGSATARGSVLPQGRGTEVRGREDPVFRLQPAAVFTVVREARFFLTYSLFRLLNLVLLCSTSARR